MTNSKLFNSYYLLLMTLISLVSCNKPSEKSPTTEYSNTELAKPIISDEPMEQNVLIEKNTFKTPSFSVDVPNGFTAKSSIPSKTLDDGFDSYYFVSPDVSAQFYIYAPEILGTPNDIIFPNEKVQTNITKKGNIYERSWTLEKSKQTPYQRLFNEFKDGETIIITGFYYKDKAVYDRFIDEYNQFKKSVR